MTDLSAATFRPLPPVRVWAILLAALIAALCLDSPSRGWAQPHAHWVEHGSRTFPLLKALGGWPVAIVAAVTLSIAHAGRWRAGVIVLLTSGLSQLIGSLLKWMVGRVRPEVADRGPFELTPFRGGLSGLFVQKNLSFPSGHATAAFSLAAVLCLFVPRGWPVWITLALLCGFERIASLSHWPSDVAGAAILGFACARLTLWSAYRLSHRDVTPASSSDARSPVA